jgi:hypothetical protein
MDDIVIEETMTYVAREIGPMYTISNSQLSRFGGSLSDIISREAAEQSGLNTEVIRP